MTDQTPIERGAEALWNRMLEGLPETSRSEWRPWDNEAPGAIDWHHDAKAVYEAIDTDELANVIEAYKSRGVDSAGIAQVVKNWLTGKDQR